MNWNVAIGLVSSLIESLALAYLCLPRSVHRIAGPWLIGAGVLGAFLGTILVIPPNVLGHHGEPPYLFPFDPNDAIAVWLFGSQGTIYADFAVGAAFPFVILALGAMAMKPTSTILASHNLSRQPQVLLRNRRIPVSVPRRRPPGSGCDVQGGVAITQTNMVWTLRAAIGLLGIVMAWCFGWVGLLFIVIAVDDNWGYAMDHMPWLRWTELAPALTYFVAGPAAGFFYLRWIRRLSGRQHDERTRQKIAQLRRDQ